MKRRASWGLFVALVVGNAFVTGCSGEQAAAPLAVPEPTTPVTVRDVIARDLAVTETASGHLEAKSAPMIAAEVSGRISEVAVDVGDVVAPGDKLAAIDPEDYRLKTLLARAEIERVEALIKSHTLQVSRLRTLVRQQSFNQSALDRAEAELGALNAQLSAARVQFQRAKRDLDRSTVVSPIAGSVDERRVSTGDFVDVGNPLFHVSTLDQLQVRLPFPETLSSVLRRGLEVRLSSPAYPGETVVGSVSQIRPIITPENRSLSIIVDLTNPGGWEPGASVVGSVVVSTRRQTVMVPDVSVVLRPGGFVVYALEGEMVRARAVRTGERRDGLIEIIEGLSADERVVVDGAAFLTDGARVEIMDS